MALPSSLLGLTSGSNSTFERGTLRVFSPVLLRYLITIEEKIVELKCAARAVLLPRCDIYRFDTRLRRDSTAIFSIYYAQRTRTPHTQATAYRSLDLRDSFTFSLRFFQLLTSRRHVQI